MKKKLLSFILALAVGLGCIGVLVACGKDDAATAKSAIETIKVMYSEDPVETPTDYTVIGQVKASDSKTYPITWKTDTTNAVVSKMDSTTKLVTVAITRAAEDISYKLTASITVGKKTESVSFDHKIPAGVFLDNADVTFDFSGVKFYIPEGNQYATAYTDAEAFEALKTAGGADHGLTAVTAKNVYPGSDATNGGIDVKDGYIKLGKSGEGATLTLTFAKPVNKIVIEAMGWKDSGKSDDDTISVNNSAGQAPTDGVSVALSYTFSATNTVTITTAKRVFIYQIAVFYAPDDAHIHNPGEFTHAEGTMTHRALCQAENCDAQDGYIYEPCEITLNNCSVCKHEYTVDEIITAAEALESNQSLPGTFSLTGVITNEVSESSGDLSFYYTVQGATKSLSIQARYVKIDTTQVEIPEQGDTVTIEGTPSKYNTTVQFNSSAGKVVSCVKPTLNDQEKVDRALAKVPETFMVKTTDATELPTSTVDGVTFAWALTDSSEATVTVTVADGMITVPTLPTSDETVKVTVTATCGTTGTGTKEVTVTIKAASQITNGILFDFENMGSTNKGTKLDNNTALALFKKAASNDTKLTSVAVTNIWEGNNNSGAYPDIAGVLKTGTGSAAGQIVLTFSEAIGKVTINCHDWYKKNASNPTNSNTVKVNGSATQLAAYNEDGTPGDLVFTLTVPSTTITIDIEKRVFIFSITVEFSTEEVDDNAVITAAKNALDLDTKTFKATEDDIELTTSFMSTTISWAVQGGNNEYVSITDNKLSILKLPTKEEVNKKFTLIATITYGEGTAQTKEIEITLEPDPQAGYEFDGDGTSEDTAFSVEDVLTIFKTLNSGDTYQKDGSNFKAYIKGYVTEIGRGGNYYSNVKIASTAGGKDTALIYTVSRGTGYESCELKVGDFIVVNGYIKNYNGTEEIAGGSGTDYAYITKWAIPDGTEAAEVTAAIAALTAYFADYTEVTKDVILPLPTRPGVTYTEWTSSNTQAITVSGGKLVVTRGESDVTVTITVKIDCGESNNYDQSYTITVKANESGPVAAHFEKITSTDKLVSGAKYLIVYEGTDVGPLVFDGSLSSLDVEGNKQSVAISDSQIDDSETIQGYTFTIEAVSGGYTIKSASGYYLGYTGAKNGMNTSQTTPYTNAISFDASGNAVITCGTAPSALRYNNAANNGTRFRYYASGQQPIALYIFVEATGGETPTPTTYTVNFYADKDAYTGSTLGTASVTGEGVLQDGNFPTNPTKDYYTFDKWLCAHCDEEVTTTFAPADHAGEGTTINVYATWTRANVTAGSVTSTAWETPAYVYPLALNKGDVLTLTADLTFLQAAAGLNVYDGVMFGLSASALTAATKSNAIFVPRYDDFVLSTANAWAGGSTYATFDNDVNWFDAYSAMIGKTGIKLTATIGYYDANLVGITYKLTANYDEADHTFEVVYKVLTNSNSAPLYVGLTGEDAKVENAVFAYATHTHNFGEALRCECGALNPAHNHTYNKDTHLCACGELDSAAGFTADYFTRSKGVKGAQFKLYELGAAAKLTKGNTLTVVGTQTSAVVENWDALLWEFSEGWTGRADNYGWIFGDTGNFAAWKPADQSPTENDSRSTNLQILDKSGSPVEADVWPYYIQITKDSTWCVSANWAEDNEVIVTVTVVANSGEYAGYTYTCTASLKLLKSVTELNLHFGAEDVTSFSVNGHKLTANA